MIERSTRLAAKLIVLSGDRLKFEFGKALVASSKVFSIISLESQLRQYAIVIAYFNAALLYVEKYTSKLEAQMSTKI